MQRACSAARRCPPPPPNTLHAQELGYGTYYVGKFLVDYSVRNYNQTPAGWTDIPLQADARRRVILHMAHIGFHNGP